MAQSSPQPQPMHTANYARLNPLPSPATSSSSSVELHLYEDRDTSSPSIQVGPPSSSQEQLLQGDDIVSHPRHISQLLLQRLLQDRHTLSLQLFLPGLMRWPQRNSHVTPHQKHSYPIGRTLVESVDRDHDRNNWFIHHPLCLRHTHNVHPYPHGGTVRQYCLSDHNHPSFSHPSTLGQRQQRTTHALTIHPEDVHKLQHKKSI